MGGVAPRHVKPELLEATSQIPNLSIPVLGQIEEELWKLLHAEMGSLACQVTPLEHSMFLQMLKHTQCHAHYGSHLKGMLMLAQHVEKYVQAMCLDDGFEQGLVVSLQDHIQHQS